MRSNHYPPTDAIPAASVKSKSIGKHRVLAAALISGGLALAGLGLASGTAQADPGPVPQHYWCGGWWSWDWGHCNFDFDHHDFEHHDHDH